jgi:hypothetical protein
VIAALSAHPNTPPETLLQLLNGSPIAAANGLFQNPILPLLPLECPDFFTRLEPWVVACLLRRADLPEMLARQFTMNTHPLLAWEARTHIVLSGKFQAGEPWDAELTEALKRAIAEERDTEARCLYMLMAYFGFGPDWLPALVAETNARLGDPLECASFQEYLSSLPSVPLPILTQARESLLQNQHIDALPSVRQWISDRPYFSAGLPDHNTAHCEALYWSIIRLPDATPEMLIYCAYRYDYALACLRRRNKSSLLNEECRLLVARSIPRGDPRGYYWGPTTIEQLPWHELIARHLHLRYSTHLPHEIGWGFLWEADFLARLACVERFRKSWNLKKHFRLLILKADPNRYVRATARGL